MHRLFLDANVLFSAAYQRHAGLRRLWDLAEVKLLTSAYAAEEARRNLRKRGQRNRLTRLLRSVKVTAATEKQQLPRGIKLPEKDGPILMAAITSKATHLLTGDVRHFGPYFGKKVRRVMICPPGEYLRKHHGNA